MVGVALTELVKKQNYVKSVVIILIVVTGIMAIRTVVRNANFKDQVTLLCHDANVGHDNFALENGCATALFREGKYDLALPYATMSVKLAPHFGTNLVVLGSIYGGLAEKNRSSEMFDKAEAALTTAMKANPGNPWASDVLGYLYTYHKDDLVAREFLKKNLKKYPWDAKLWYYLAIVEYKSGKGEAARKAIDNAHTLDATDEQIAKLYLGFKSNVQVKMGDKFYDL
jgi:tetratricopeptide (TPR) repeat protein